VPAGTVGEVAPAAEPWEREGEQDESDELHVEQGAQGAHALGGEAREEIGAAPGQRRQDAQQNSHDGLGGLARGLTRGGRCGFFSLQAEDGHHFLQIFPDFAFCAGIAQQIRGVIGGHQLSSAELKPLATEMRNAAIGLEQRLRGYAAEANDYFGSDGVQLAKQEGRANFYFVFFGGAIFGWAALHYVADVNVCALQAHGFDHLVQQFSRAADKRQTLGVFIAARAFAHENELGVGISVAEDELVAATMQFAAGAIADVGENFWERIAGDLVHGFE